MLGALVALAWLTACAPNSIDIDTSDMQAFEKSLAAAKRSLPQSDQERLQNAIFALTMSEITLEWRESPLRSTDLDSWALLLRSYSGSPLLTYDMGTGKLEVSRKNFLVVFRDVTNVPPRGANPQARSISMLLERALELKLDVTSPIAAMAERLAAPKKLELQQKIKSVVRVFEDPHFVPYTGLRCDRMSFSIRNETEWPIVAIVAKIDEGYRYVRSHKIALADERYDLSPALAPGGTSKVFEVESSGYCKAVWSIIAYRADGSSFETIRPDDVPYVKKTIEKVAKTDAILAGGLEQLMGWLKDIR